MIITDITDQKHNRGRMNLFIDGAFYASVSAYLVEKREVFIGKEVTCSQLDKIIFDSDKAVAFDYTCWYLDRYPSTVKKMKDKLYSKGYSRSVVEYAVDKAIDCHILDDRRYALNYYDYRKNSCGIVKIIAELKAKGVDKDVIAQISDMDSQSDEDSAFTSAMRLTRRHSNGQVVDAKYLARLGRYLASKGYSWDIIRRCIDDIRSGNEDFN